MSLEHFKVNKLVLNDLQHQSVVLINTGGGLQYITSHGSIIKTIFDLSSNIIILYKSLDYPVLKKYMNLTDGYLIHFAKKIQRI